MLPNECVKILEDNLLDFLKAYSQSRGIDFKLNMAKANYLRKNGNPMNKIIEEDAIRNICQEVKFDKIIEALQLAIRVMERLSVDNFMEIIRTWYYIHYEQGIKGGTIEYEMYKKLATALLERILERTSPNGK